MENKTPSWIKEILSNDTECSAWYPLVESGRLEAIKKHAKCKILKGNIDDIVNALTYKSRRKLRVMFFRDGPFLPISTGAANSIYGLMNALSDRGVEVYLLYSYRGWSDKRLYLKQKFSTIFISPDDFYNNKKLISKIVLGLNIDICHLDSAEAVCLQCHLLPRHKTRLLFEVHNIENELMKQLKLPLKDINNIKVYEQKAFSLADIVIVRSEQNCQSAIDLGCDKGKIYVYKGSIDVGRIKFLRRSLLRKNTMLFLGHLNYGPNQQAVELAIEIAKASGKKLLIAGKGALFLKQKYSSNKIKFLGRVENLNGLFSKVDIAIAPIISGSGTRIKILDYMAAGIPVVCTDMAIEGLEPQIKRCLVVENNISKYPELISKLYEDKNKTKIYSIKGRKYVEKHRDWKVNVKDVLSAYNQKLYV
ncbi:glycosyltransferase family 4 protein [Patescibacteria group bacterium]|nr:glycosyltransferase family 4 protein [Patescibacteria group bacterium]